MRSYFDLQSLAYMLLYVGLIIFQWLYGFHRAAYAGVLFFAVCMQIVHHNHVHTGIWHSKSLNRLTGLFISVVTAVPGAMMIGGHIKNHHVHQHGPDDVTRTYRFGGDHNHFAGYLLHPVQAFSVLIPMFWRDFLDGLPKRTWFARSLFLQVSLIFLSWAILVIVDWQKFLVYVLLPQAFGLHWLLGANYLQHAHCDDESEVNYARNFTGAINWLWLNIGFHTAHHDHPKAHWSELRGLHKENCSGISPELCQRSFVYYCIRVFILSPFLSSLKSRSLKSSCNPGTE